MNMNDAMAAASAEKQENAGAGAPALTRKSTAAPKMMRELTGKASTIRSLKGWRKLRSIGALQISEGSAAATHRPVISQSQTLRQVGKSSMEVRRP